MLVDKDGSACEDTLGGRISLGREAVGLSVEEAACHLGVLAETWRDWECDRDAPRANRLTMMAGLLGVSPCWLLTGAGTGPVDRKADHSADLLRAVRQISEETASLNRRLKEIAEDLTRQQRAERAGRAA
ncbi:helix-turn-helix domain-containing protein [Chelativorans sp. Marseille-P2723]|uniref:helix-turn-helix domain-containing protein n=1 Tax=Chelativorans sp. Marseille-P2723 TaxID=2709133 RepID=UPI00156F56CD|nr:helix-turn-helix domain-containing protein [Chelativorans sp. Marseille-P2723]